MTEVTDTARDDEPIGPPEPDEPESPDCDEVTE